MMSQSETSYFTLRPCDKRIGTTDPKAESQKQLTTSLPATDSNYLHGLDLPSLPPLSHLLTTDVNDNKNTTCQENDMNSTNSNESSPVSTSATSSVGQALVDQEQQEQQLFTGTTTSLPMTTSTAAAISAMTDSMGIMAPSSMDQTPVTTETLAMLMDPTSAEATSMYLPTSQNDNPNIATTTAAPLMGNNAILPSSSTGHPSSFYNIPSTSPTKYNTNADLTSLMMPPNNTQDSKNYSFVEIPGSNQRKRPRRRYDEIERLYHCTWPGCTKSYGTLNHLNAHVSMQKHGEKRHPAEFKEMRRNWRRQKKEREIAKKAAEKESLNANSMVNNTTLATASAVGLMMPALQPYNTYAPFPMYTSLPQNMASIGAFY